MEAMLGISLYSYFYLKLAKMLSFLLLVMSSLQQNWRRGQNSFFLEVMGGKIKGVEAVVDNCPNNVCTYE
jgi:hypothetical protein